jgi:Carboxypeptidase regulatory-like domain/TonB dependent receptor
MKMLLRKTSLLLMVIGCFVISHPQAASAQGIITGTITGTITDPSGAVLPGVPFVATNTATDTKIAGKTDNAGAIKLSDVPVGTYTVVVTAPSFAPLKIDNLQVTSGGTSSVGVQHLSVSSTAQEVSVSTAQNLLETSQAQITSTFDTQSITDLPTGGGLDKLTLLIPGVVRTLGDNFSNTNGVGFSSNGQRGRSNNFEIDGQSNNDNSVAGPQFFFRNEDALQELNVITNNYGAQYGRDAGSIVNYITKSGTNSFHGTAFENYFGSWGSSLTQNQKAVQFGFCPPGQTNINGASCTPAIVPRVTANEFGGTIGGPVFKDKLFFFAGLLFRRTTNGASPSVSTTTTPTPTGLTQLQTDFPGNPFVASLVNQGPYSVKSGNPVAVASTVANVIVCAGAFTNNTPVLASSGSPTNVNCPAGTPAFPIQVSDIQRFLPSTSSDDEQIYRGDYQATTKDRFYLRFMYQNNPTHVSGGTVSTGNYYDTNAKVYSAGGDWTHTFSSRWVDQLRYGFQQADIIFGDGGYPGCDDSNLSICPSSIAISGFAGYGQANNIPQGRIVKATQAQDNANVSLGAHQITFGGEFDYQNSPNVFLPNTSGTFSFNGFNYALAGVSSLSLANGNPNIPFKEPDWALYFQDDYKVRRDLTLNLGLRWEYFSQSINLLHNESVARQTGPNPIWLTSLPLSQTTFPLVPQNYKNFGPRIGFAYTPPFKEGMVIRGGFSMNYDPAYYNIFLNAYTSAPIVNTGVINCNGTTVNCLPSGGTTMALVQAQNAQYNPTGVNPGVKTQSTVNIPFKNPIAENYTLGIQQQVGRLAVAEVRYVGNHSYDEFQNLNGNAFINAAPPTTTVTAAQNYKTLAQGFPNLFPSTTYCTTANAVGLGTQNCNLTTLSTRANTAFSIYNSLQAQLRIENYHGIFANAAYTYSRTIDNADEVYSTATGGGTISTAQSPFNTNQAERAVAGNSYPNVFTLSMVYQVPFYSEQRGFMGRLLGGYSVNTIWTYNSGQVYTPVQSSKANPNAAVTAKIPTANVGQALFSFCDFNYNTNIIGNDSCRPILSNPSAPIGSVGINGGPGVGYLNYGTGAPIARDSVHWLLNNEYEAEALGTPYPGVGRSTLRGNTVNELDMSVFKTIRINERFSAQLRLNAYNVPNRAYYGTPDFTLNNSDPSKHVSAAYPGGFNTFNTYFPNAGGGVAAPFGKGTRNIQLGGKIIF